MGIIVTDLDNCISDDNWRLNRIDPKIDCKEKRYHAYHSLAPFDEMRNEEIVKGKAAEGRVLVVITARPLAFFAATKEWLNRNGIVDPIISMREFGDTRPSHEIKVFQLKSILKYLSASNNDVEVCYDDKPSVLEAYLKHGFRAKRVAINSGRH